MGGIRAVIVTDFMQFLFLFSGAVAVIITITHHFGGFSWFPTQWQSHWDKQPFIDFDPSTRVSIVGVWIMGLFWCVCTIGGDQVAIQRIMSTKDVPAARRSYLTSMLADVLITCVLCLVGFGLMAYVRQNPGGFPAGLGLDTDADSIFPYFIAFHLPPGVSGLVVAAMFAAAMSSIDSGVNSITAVVMTDYLDRFDMRPKTERGHVIFAKILAFAIGAIVIFGSSFIGKVPGNITEVANKTVNLFMTPMFCLFFFAMFVPFARPIGVFAGMVCGYATAVLIAYSGPIFGFDPVTNYDPVSFMWIIPGSFVVNIGVGTIVSFLVSRGKSNG